MNSSGESTAPLDYQHISSSSEDTGNILLSTEDCPLCLKPSRNFYCKSCLKDGEFLHSNGKNSETFSDKRMRLLLLQKEKTETEKLCERKLSERMSVTAVKGSIEELKDRNGFLKLLIEQKKSLVHDKMSRSETLKRSNSEKKVRLRRYEERVEKLRVFVGQKQKELDELKRSLDGVQEELKRKRRLDIKQLVTYIFPISEAEGSKKLKELRIVAPTLPASGDYSAYSDWIAANKDCVPSSSVATHVYSNPAYNISAALTYTTQLVNMLAYYLDVRLPAKLFYADFCSEELSKGRFQKKVARLNWNVLHLCLSQNVKTCLLKPESTLSNILLLLDQTVSDLGRSLTPDMSPEEARRLEDALKPLLEASTEDPEDSGDEGLSYDWEAVPSSSGLPESDPSQEVPLSQQVSTTSGLITSTAASLVSFLRWNR